MKTASAVESSPAVARKFDESGFEIFPIVLSQADCDSLAAELTPLFTRQRSGSRTRIGGVRNLLRLSKRISTLATSSELTGLLEQITGKRPFPVRSIFFDKTAESNWRVPWHQDLTIAVKQRIDTPGFGPWSIKEGIPHVQPPLSVLENMIAVRLHLDACDESNGALRVIPSSHLKGELSANEITALTTSGLAETCSVPSGGAVLMRPLLLHASSPATSPSHRRVVHIEYAGEELPNGLEWFDR